MTVVPVHRGQAAYPSTRKEAVRSLRSFFSVSGFAVIRPSEPSRQAPHQYVELSLRGIESTAASDQASGILGSFIIRAVKSKG
jgi:hypothetical protein